MLKKLSLVLIISFAWGITSELEAQFQSDTGGALVRITQPGQLSDTLSVWGDVLTPGRYLVPRGSTLAEFMQYAGGPNSSRNVGRGNPWSRLRLSVTVSQYDAVTQEMDLMKFHLRFNDEVPREMREFRLTNDDIVTIEVRQAPGFLDVLGVVGPILATVTTSILLYDRVIR
ncbi:hypothetical protein [Rhodohalobacter sp. 8-1]|uniref:hypothetical protein n=1 Tax=Rhodohalobacter sp. 8-1 TaxID=3131972 RepID=UPI0030EEFA98